MLGIVVTACNGRARTPTPMPLIGPDAAAVRIGQEVHVRMRIECSEPGARDQPTYLKPNCYYEGYLFRVGITGPRKADFDRIFRMPPEAYLIGRMVDVRGVVQRNGSWSEILIESTDQLKLASGLLPPREPTPISR